MIADRANRHAFALCWLPSGFPWDALSSTGIIAAGTQPMTKGLYTTGVWNLAAASQRKSGN